jgi:enoyl-CoA hydratase
MNDRYWRRSTDPTTLAEGLLFERRASQATFAFANQTEGMTAFLEKRPAVFTNR